MQMEKGEKETTSDGISTPSQPLDSSVIETTPSPNSTPNVREPENSVATLHSVNNPSQTRIVRIGPNVEIERNRDTINPKPHQVFPSLSFPKTGGRLGNNYILWGNELKHTYFPFVAIAGPDWYMTLISYIGFILLTFFNYGIIKTSIDSLLYTILFFTIAFVFFFFLLITTLSNPGIVFRGQPADSKKPLLSECRICEVSRPAKACHCERCNTCCYELDHHCPWMGKCIGRNTLVCFYIAVGGFFILCFIGMFTVMIATAIKLNPQ